MQHAMQILCVNFRLTNGEEPIDNGVSYTTGDVKEKKSDSVFLDQTGQLNQQINHVRPKFRQEIDLKPQSEI